MALFGKKQPDSYLGIDISHDAIKVIELKNFEGKPQLVTYGYSDSRKDVMKGNFVDNVNITSTLLKEICDRSGCVSNRALAALPVSQTFTSVLKVNQITKKDLDSDGKVKEILGEEAKKILPMDIKEMQFDYTVVDPQRFAKLKDSDVARDVKFLITAAPNVLVRRYTQIFSQAGIELLNLDINPFALVRSLIGNDPSLIMIVDIGENTTALSIVDSGIPVYNKSVEVGGAVITKRLADTMQIDFAEAEQYKIDLPILMKQQNLSEMPKPVEVAISPVISEIKYLIKTYYERISKEKDLDRIILTGGGAALAGLKDHIIKEVNVRTYIGDPWARIVYPRELEGVLEEIGPRFASAIGLAMTKIS